MEIVGVASPRREQKSVPTPYYLINLKNIPQRYRTESLLKVLPTSPLLLRRGVEKIARYFLREFHYDSIQFDQNDRGPYTAYLFADSDQSVWAGACCFRSRYFRDIDMETEALQWVWLHPYFRGRGILKSCWKTLRDSHGDFCMAPPVSPPMREFLLIYNKDSAWYPIFQCKKPDLADIKTKLTCARIEPAHLTSKPKKARNEAGYAVGQKGSSDAVHYGPEGAPVRRTISIVIPDKRHIPTVTELARREASLKRTKNWKRKTKKKDRKIVSEGEGQGGVHFVQGGLPELGRR